MVLSTTLLAGCGRNQNQTQDGECYSDGWEDAVSFPLQTTGSVVAVYADGETIEALMYEGILVRIDGGGERFDLLPAIHLRAFAHPGAYTIVVGDDGVILRSEASEWSSIDAGVGEDLVDVIATDPDSLLALASDRLLRSTDQGQTWSDVAGPSGAWSGLRQVQPAGDRVVLIGSGGQIWEAAAPFDDWTAIDLGSDAEILDGADLECSGCVALVTNQTVHVRQDGEWSTIPAPAGHGFTAATERFVATSTTLYEYTPGLDTLGSIASTSRPSQELVVDGYYRLLLLRDDGLLDVVEERPCF